jgi:hypothetical protein
VAIRDGKHIPLTAFESKATPAKSENVLMLAAQCDS